MKNLIIIITLLLATILAYSQNDITIIDMDENEIFTQKNCVSFGDISDGYALIRIENSVGNHYNEKVALINLNEKKASIPEGKYAWIGGIEEGHAIVASKDGLDYSYKRVKTGEQADYPFLGLIDINTKRIIIPIEYVSISKIFDGKYRVASKRNEFCIFDKSGKKLFCKEGKFSEYLNDGAFSYMRQKKNTDYNSYEKLGLQIITTDQKELLPTDLKINYIGKFHDGLIKIRKKDLDGYINKEGKEIIPFKYKYAPEFKNGVVTLKENDKYGLLDNTGKIIIPFVHGFLSNRKDGFISFKKDKLYGLMDRTGKIIIEPKYDYIPDFKNGLTYVKDAEERVSIINEKGGIVMPMGLGLKLNKLNGEILTYTMDDKKGLMNVNGDEILAPEYDLIRFATDNHWVVTNNSKSGLFSLEKGWILDIEYDEIYMENGLGKFQDVPGDTSYILKKGELKGIYYKGKILEPKFKFIGVANDGFIPVIK